MSHYKAYPEYKESGVKWIGSVPEHWELTRFKYVSELNPKKSTITTERNELCTFLPMEKLKTDTIILDETRVIDEVYDGYSYFADDDILIAKVTPCFENKNIAVAKGLVNGVGFGSTEINTIRAKANANNRFLYYRLQEDQFLKIAISEMTGSGGLKRVPSELFQIFKFAIPSYEEQALIAAQIDKENQRIHTLITKKTRFIELLKEKRQALITHAVTKGLNPHVKMKDSGVEWIGKVPEHWKISRLKYLISQCQNGVWGDDPLENGTDTLCIRVADFDRDNLRVIDTPSTYRQINSEHQVSRLVSKGDILLEKSGGGEKTLVGANVQYLGNKNAVCSNFVAVIKTSEKSHPEWLNYLMSAMYSLRLNLRSIKQATGIQNLDSEQYLDEVIAFPSKEEQIKISNSIVLVTARIDTLIAKTQKSIDLLKEHRSAFISAAVTGQIDLRGEQA